MRRRTGHLRQNWFFSCALSASHLCRAARYVEWNRTLASIVVRAEAHPRGGGSGEVVDFNWDLRRELGSLDGWRQLLEELPDVREDHQLWWCSCSGMPFGESGFVEEMGSAVRKAVACAGEAKTGGGAGGKGGRAV